MTSPRQDRGRRPEPDLRAELAWLGGVVLAVLALAYWR
jgi:hypothetical protein